MKIGCVCVTEKRAPVFDIAAACFATMRAHIQNVFGMSLHLFVGLSTVDEFDAYQDVLQRYDVPAAWTFRDGSTSDRQHELVEYAFASGCKLVMVCDDDDWHPWTRSLAAVHAYESHGSPFVFGTYLGWFVNLRTLKTHVFEQDRFWGGSLVFDRAGFEAGGGIAGREFVGADKVFIEQATCAGAVPPRSDTGRAPRMLAFSHGANLTTQVLVPEPGWDEARMYCELSVIGHQAIKRAQKFLIDRRIFPPGSTE